MQLQFDLKATYEIDDLDEIALPLLWLKNWRWTALFHRNLDRKIARHRRIVAKLFPNGISQADFMKVIVR